MSQIEERKKTKERITVNRQLFDFYYFFTKLLLFIIIVATFVVSLKGIDFNSISSLILFLGLYLVSIISFMLLSFARGCYLDILNDYEKFLNENEFLQLSSDKSL